MRIFAADRIENLMKSLNVEETMPIESKFLTKMIESSQKKVEGRNFSIRKNVLNYDDVMNKQREIIYDQRAKVLNGDDLHESIINMIKVLISDTVDRYLLEDGEDKENWNIIALKEYFLGWITNEDDFKDLEDDADKFEAITKKEVTDMLTERALKIYSDKEEQYGKEVIRELERVILLRVVDSKWTAHIDDMDELKKGISLRAYGQKNPVVEYRYEGFEMFDAMVESIREDTVRMLLTVKLSNNQVPERVQVNKPDAPNAGSGDGSFSSQAVSNKTGDNELCPCGSGKKYKKCCGLNSDN